MQENACTFVQSTLCKHFRTVMITLYLPAKGGPKKESKMSSESNGIGGFASLAAEVASQQLNAFHAMIKTNCC